MSLEIIKSGLHDSIQDGGRFGYQHVGLNPTGAMDLMAMRLANTIVGNNEMEAVLEICFPACSIIFHSAAMITIGGADFSAKVNDVIINCYQPIVLPAGSILTFKKRIRGSFTYLAVHGGFDIPLWLGSKSTHLLAKLGGYKRTLKKGDIIPLVKKIVCEKLEIFPWRFAGDFTTEQTLIRCTQGQEFSWLSKEAQKSISRKSWTLEDQSNRMGYYLKGVVLKQVEKKELISTAVTMGTVQLLPNGQLIILTADHQTTGGYPRVLQVIDADRSKLVQCSARTSISFKVISLDEAEELTIAQEVTFRKLYWSCYFKWKVVPALNEEARKWIE